MHETESTPRPAGRATAEAVAVSRIEAIDFTRGVAVALMILSHGVKGLLDFSQIPSWGLVPIHLLTKFSSSLFILVFGISLAVAFLPSTDTPQWSAKRQKLWIRGLVVFFWYKVLTIVEMAHLYKPEDILDTLLYRAFPSFVEILGFYAIALLWVPMILPLWKRTPLWGRLVSPLAFIALGTLLAGHFNFWGNESLQAILVEHKGDYTWGQISRGPLILAGLLAGELIRATYHRRRARYAVAAFFALCASLLLLSFTLGAAPELQEQLVSIAKNEGKHPPELSFMLFSVGGALLILSAALLGGERLAKVFRPITLIGTNSLQAFIFHIFVIFVFFRYLLGMWHQISYPHALTLSLLLILASSLWIKTLGWVHAKS